MTEIKAADRIKILEKRILKLENKVYRDSKDIWEFICELGAKK